VDIRPAEKSLSVIGNYSVFHDFFGFCSERGRQGLRIDFLYPCELRFLEMGAFYC
jgi:hypothetical protein